MVDTIESCWHVKQARRQYVFGLSVRTSVHLCNAWMNGDTYETGHNYSVTSTWNCWQRELVSLILMHLVPFCTLCLLSYRATQRNSHRQWETTCIASKAIMYTMYFDFDICILVQRSANDDWKNFVNAVAPESVKSFRPNLPQVFSTVGPRTD